MNWLQAALSAALYVGAIVFLKSARTEIDVLIVAVIVGFANLSLAASSIIANQRRLIARIERLASPPAPVAESAPESQPAASGEGGFRCGNCRRPLWLPDGPCPGCGSRLRVEAR